MRRKLPAVMTFGEIIRPKGRANRFVRRLEQDPGDGNQNLDGRVTLSAP
jgi:hypothetical protein